MNKLIFPISFFILCLFTTCTKVEKDVHNYYPQVKTKSVTINADGSIEVFGEIISSGSTSITNCGICMDTVPNPHMISNQTQATVLNGNTFSCTYSSLNAIKKYYFRAWCTNDYGYAIGDDVSASNISFDTTSIPCHPESGYMVLTGATGAADERDRYNYSMPLSELGSEYTMTMYSGGHSLSLTFYQFPISGIYTTGGGDLPVILKVDEMVASKGHKVYVQQIDDHNTDITICDAVVYAKAGFFQNFYLFNMATKFRFPN